jgi:hypothetical protein
MAWTGSALVSAQACLFACCRFSSLFFLHFSFVFYHVYWLLFPLLNHVAHVILYVHPAGYNQVLSEQLLKWHGTLTPAATINDVLPIVQTGDVHAAVYDLTAQQMYVSFYVTNSSSVPLPKNAYDRAFTQLDLNALFAEPAPTTTL